MKQQVEYEKKLNREALNLARSGYSYAIGALGLRTQFSHCRDESDWLTRFALMEACFTAGEQRAKIEPEELDDLLEAIDEAITGISRHPATWEILDKATVSTNQQRFIRQLKPLREPGVQKGVRRE